MTTIISGNTPSTIGNDTTISGDITANNLPANGSIVGYQQGGWTPTATQLASFLAEADRTRWSRVGQMVTLWAYISLINSSSTSTAVLYVKGLPYPVEFNNSSGSAMVQRCGRTINNAYLSLADQGIAFYTIGNAAWEPLTPSNINSAGNNGAMFFSVTYQTDDTTWTPSNGATVS